MKLFDNIFKNKLNDFSSSQLFPSLSPGMSTIQREPPLPYLALSTPAPKPPQLQLIHGQVPLAPPLPCSPPITLSISPIQLPTPQFTLVDNLYRRPKLPDQQPPAQPQQTIEEKLRLALTLPFTNFEKKISDPSKDEDLKYILALHRNGFWCPSYRKHIIARR